MKVSQLTNHVAVELAELYLANFGQALNFMSDRKGTVELVNSCGGEIELFLDDCSVEGDYSVAVPLFTNGNTPRGIFQTDRQRWLHLFVDPGTNELRVVEYGLPKLRKLVLTAGRIEESPQSGIRGRIPISDFCDSADKCLSYKSRFYDDFCRELITG